MRGITEEKSFKMSLKTTLIHLTANLLVDPETVYIFALLPYTSFKHVAFPKRSLRWLHVLFPAITGRDCHGIPV